jgi:3-hydroxyacyl-[acyl-carrier-protein] dehydratase
MRRETIITIPADHPAFAGHFPGTPIVPGVVLLDEALFAIQSADGLSLDACRIASAKFFHPVGPGTVLVVRHEMLAIGSIQFDIMDGPRKVASGSLLFPTVPQSVGSALL